MNRFLWLLGPFLIKYMYICLYLQNKYDDFKSMYTYENEIFGPEFEKNLILGASEIRHSIT